MTLKLKNFTTMTKLRFMFFVSNYKIRFSSLLSVCLSVFTSILFSLNLQACFKLESYAVFKWDIINMAVFLMKLAVNN